MINKTLQEFFTTVSEHLKNNDLLEDETVEYVLSLLNSSKRHETVFSGYVVSKQLRIRVSVFGGEPKRFIKIPVFKLIRHTYRTDTDGFMLDKRRHTIGELVLDAVSEREEPYRYKHGQFKAGDVVCRITREGKYAVGLMYEEFDREQYPYIHLIDDDKPFCCPGSIMEDISWCKRVALAGTKDLSYLNTMKHRESKEEMDDLIRRDIGHIIKANFEWDRFQELDLNIEDEITSFVKAEIARYKGEK